jgi:hypothetical protein
MNPPGFLGGVVEGFYGQPWTVAQRRLLFAWMSAWGLNTYLYAPKDDLKHRALWREPYDASESEVMGGLIAEARVHGVRFVYGLSPGLDLRPADALDRSRIKARFDQLLRLGCDDFALLFDDLPGALAPGDLTACDSVAAFHAEIANDVFGWVREQRPQGRFLFCPTPYCDRMVRWQLGGADYLETIGAALDPAIDVLWTGPEIVSREIPVASIHAVSQVLRRAPVLWDNLHANDYDLRRVYCGPYSGRPPGLRDAVRGILANPNNEFAINQVPLRTLAAYLDAPAVYDPRAAYLAAMAEWLREFETIGRPLLDRDLVLLGDCYYLPHEEGPEAEQLHALVDRLVHSAPASWGEDWSRFQQLNRRVQSIFERLTELRRRELFYAWSRRAWELKEELQLFEAWLSARSAQPDAEPLFVSEGHLPATYRGGIVARLQRLLEMDERGMFRPAGPMAGGRR